MSKLLFGSIDFSRLLELAKAGDKSFTKHKNGKLYVGINVWINDKKDDFDNDASIQTNFKEATKEQRHYFGNLKFSEFKEPKPLGAEDTAFIPEEEDLPF